MLDNLPLPAERPRCYDDIQKLKKATGRRIPDLLAMACQNDPFYILPAQAKQAEWFAALWERFTLPAGVHLRRIHYKLISQSDPVLMVDGRPYQNTELCWQYLGAASKAARCLGLVDAGAFEDKRNPDPVITRDYGNQPHPRFWLRWENYEDDWRVPTIAADLTDDLDWTIPSIRLEGYEPSCHDQPFHLELISEKSTMDDIVIPLCKTLGVNYAPATGFQSITGVVALLRRLRQADKPGVVLYVSDFDPAGSFMPPSVARQIEFWLPRYAPGLDVLLAPIVLTREQVINYDLPPIPIKETDRRQDNFLARHGVTGATELDALEALHPGELAKIIRQAIAPYRDADAENNARRIYWQADKEISRRWEALCRPYDWRLTRLKEQAADVLENYRAELEALRDAMDEELDPIRTELDRLRQAVKAELREFEPDLPDRYESPLSLPDCFDGLFDSRRDYLRQIDFYKATDATDEEAAP